MPIGPHHISDTPRATAAELPATGLPGPFADQPVAAA
jgi:hypothetical protein